ncbi:uncharacterized protein LOC112089772 [Eutrema salsugineum]|uniref:uncharacterized protein LOC112089772 n=1 Tax=Eutrema salsugineum TaxID=72664 RepID=UPI000CED5A92|nr:uncharacterized protein LOC112089772 [Eutrema salsugineum]
MASSSNNGFDDSFDDIIDDIIDQKCDDLFDAVLDRHTASKQKKKHTYIEREREQGHIRLWNDYFCEGATYPPHIFRRRFRMTKDLFLRIVGRLSNEVPYFQQRRNAHGSFGLSGLQKCTTTIRMMAYGCAADAVDEYLRLGTSTALLCLKNFTEGIIQLFGDEYLRRPTADDLQRLLDNGEARGFPGMI